MSSPSFVFAGHSYSGHTIIIEFSRFHERGAVGTRWFQNKSELELERGGRVDCGNAVNMSRNKIKPMFTASLAYSKPFAL
jgi:hypothetical protein